MHRLIVGSTVAFVAACAVLATSFTAVALAQGECGSPQAAGAKTITLQAGCPEYLYVGSTSGGAPIKSPSWTQDLSVTALYSGNKSISIGHSGSNTGHFTTSSGNYGIAGVGVSGTPTLTAVGQTSEVGPGCTGCGTTVVAGPKLSVSFSLSSASDVAILVGGEGTGTLSLSGVSGAVQQVDDTYSEGGGGVLASVGIWDVSNLAAGSYTATISSKTTLNNSGESLGAAVYELP